MKKLGFAMPLLANLGLQASLISVTTPKPGMAIWRLMIYGVLDAVLALLAVVTYQESEKWRN